MKLKIFIILFVFILSLTIINFDFFANRLNIASVDLPFHAVVPIKLSSNKGLLINPIINGRRMEMELDLSSNYSTVCGMPTRFLDKDPLSQNEYTADIKLGTYVHNIHIIPGEQLPRGGVIGANVFAQLKQDEIPTITIDCKKKILTIDYKIIKNTRTPNKTVTKVRNADGKITVRCNDKVDVTLSLATNYSKTVLPWSIAKKFLKIDSFAKFPRSNIIAIPIELKIGDRSFKITCFATKDNEVGVLGMDFLKNYLIIIDYKLNMLYLENIPI